MITTRPETAEDHDAIASVVARAFGSRAEAELVESIRASPNYVAAWSLVATVNDKVVGHVMASCVTLRAVDPDAQRRGKGVRPDVRGHVVYPPAFDPFTH